jgi:hypothetical protein
MALLISDPTTLITGGDAGTAFASPVVFDVSTKTITITPGSGILPAAADGVTGQALYSAAKIIWKNSSTYIKYPFPMEAITPESFEFVNGWILANDVTRKALRTCGWAERGAAGTTIVRKHMGVVSLGSIGESDFSYYQWNTGSKADFNFTGPINEAIQIYGDASNGNFDYSDGGDSLKLFNRIQGKLFTGTNNTAIGATTLGYITYRFPLSNATDLNVSASDSHIAATISSMTGLTGTGNGTVYTFTKAAHGLDEGERIRIVGATPASLNGVHTVVSTGFTSGVFAIASTETTALSAITSISGIHAAITFDSLSGTEVHDVNEDTVNETYKYIINDATGVANTREIYEKMQYLLRQNSDISAGATTVTGVTANSIAAFVGSTLVGEPGVYINGIADAIKNFVEYYQLSDTTKSTKILYPFIASGSITFGGNAGSTDFKYWMFYKTLPISPAGSENNDYGQTNARIVKDSTGTPIAGTYSGSTVNWSFKYDSETADYGNGAERTAQSDADIVVVGIGLTGGQFISVESVIRRATGQGILLAPAIERNYQNPV